MTKKAMDILTESIFYAMMAFSTGPMCGIDVADYIEKRTGGRVKIGPATLYTILGKFEKEKWIREIEVEGRKRTYSITDKGVSAYEQEVEDLECVCGMLKMQQMKCRDSFAVECGLFPQNLYGGFKDGGEKRYKKCAPHHTMSRL